MVAAFHPLAHLAVQPGQSIRQQGLFGGAGVQLKACKAIGTGFERLQELLHQGGFAAFGQHVQGEAIALVQQRFHGTVLGHGHGDAGGTEAGLAHPAGHHGAAQLRFAGGEHAEGADHTAQGQHRWIAAAFAQAPRTAPLRPFLALQQLAGETGAGFLQLLHPGGIRTELHPDRLEAKAEAAIPQLRFQQVHRLAAPAEAAEHPHGLAAIPLRQQGSQGRDDRCGGMAPQGG